MIVPASPSNRSAGVAPPVRQRLPRAGALQPLVSKIAAVMLAVMTGFVGIASARAQGAPQGTTQGTVWRLDPDHTEVRFSWDHLGISRQSGELTELYGRLEFDPNAPTGGRVEVTALLTGLRTGVPALDQILLGIDYFNARRFPRITFVSTEVRPTGPRAGELTGMVTMRGVTKPVTFEAEWNFSGEHPLAQFNPVHRNQFVSGFHATAKISRGAWGMTQAAPLISDEISITINAEFIRVD